MREKFKISLVELAAISGLPAGYLCEIEEGKIPALKKDLDRIAKALEKIADAPPETGK